MLDHTHNTAGKDEHTGIATQVFVGRKIVVGRSSYPVVGGIVRGVRGFPAERHCMRSSKLEGIMNCRKVLRKKSRIFQKLRKREFATDDIKDRKPELLEPRKNTRR
jgi:hypothetical protein